MSSLRARRPPRAVVAVAAAAAAAALAVHRWVFPYLSVDHDEPLYALQAAWMRHWATTVPAAQERFRPWLSGRHGDRLISVFQPVWPAVLAVSSAVTGSFQPAMAAVAAAIAVLSYLFALELVGDRRIAVLTTVVVAASPFVWLRSGTMLAYGWSLTLELLIGVLVLRARRAPTSRGWVAIGVVAGVLAFTRPFDAIVLGVPIALWLALELRRDFPRVAALVVLGAAPALALTALNNLHLTGSALEFPLHAAGGDNQFGFGMRRIAPGAPLIRVTFPGSVRAAGVDIWRAVAWSFGSVFAVPVAVLGVFRLRQRRLALAVLAVVAVLFPFANLFYWGNYLIAHAKDFLGPHYYLPLAVVLAVLVAAGVRTIAERSTVWAAAVVVVLAVASIVQVIPKIRDNRYFTNLAATEWRTIDAAVGNDRALVVLPASLDGGWLGHPRPSMLNDLGLRQRILFAPDRGSDDLSLAADFPDRKLLRLEPTYLVKRTGVRMPPTVVPVVPYDVPAMRFDVTVTPQTDDAVVRVYVTNGHEQVSSNIDNVTQRGVQRVVPVTLTADGTVQIGDVTGRVPLDAGVSIGVAYAPAGAPADTLVQEDRIWTHVRDGRLDLALPGQQWWAFRRPEGFLQWVAEPLGGLRVEAASAR